ncbi:hypothetical protein GF351_02545 [Candidatus Woesearchaeota archaeon]|nr:hypothetical protein [Candidatus Woesearchaeota archaeon]
MMDKKGVSPLIATVLLIAFAVALGAVVMNWGRAYVEQTADDVEGQSETDIKCSFDVSMEVIRIDDVPQLCYCNLSDPAYIEFTLQNIGREDIEDLQLVIIGESGIVSNSSILNKSLGAADVIKQKLKYDLDKVGTIKQIQMVPMIMEGSSVVPCSQRKLEKGLRNIVNCTGCEAS